LSINRQILILLIPVLLFSLTGPVYQSDSISELSVSKLPAGEQVFESGQVLVDQPYGFTHIVDPAAIDRSQIHITVHGYDTRGYEWVVPVTNLAAEYAFTFFWRYDWEECPNKSGRDLAEAVQRLIEYYPSAEKIVIMGHSLGGNVVTYSAFYLQLTIPVEIHTIAAPLAGVSRLLDNCGLDSNRDGIPDYPVWKRAVTHTQWRTVHSQDNAFNKYDLDPQKIDLSDSKVIQLPSTMDGHRLGHNWSATWVIRDYLGMSNSP